MRDREATSVAKIDADLATLARHDLDRRQARAHALRASLVVLVVDLIVVSALFLGLMLLPHIMMLGAAFVVFFGLCVTSFVVWGGAGLLVVSASTEQGYDVLTRGRLLRRRRALLDASEVKGALEVHVGGMHEGALTLGAGAAELEEV